MSIELKPFGSAAFDYFPGDFLAEEVAKQDLDAEYKQHQTIIHTSDLYDLSKVKAGYRVRTHTGEVGTITDHHNTEVGKLNGGVEVELDNGKTGYYYANQLTRIL